MSYLAQKHGLIKNDPIVLNKIFDALNASQLFDEMEKSGVEINEIKNRLQQLGDSKDLFLNGKGKEFFSRCKSYATTRCHFYPIFGKNRYFVLDSSVDLDLVRMPGS